MEGCNVFLYQNIIIHYKYYAHLSNFWISRFTRIVAPRIFPFAPPRGFSPWPHPAPPRWKMLRHAHPWQQQQTAAAAGNSSGNYHHNYKASGEVEWNVDDNEK